MSVGALSSTARSLRLERIRTSITRSEYCSAVFILVAELLLRFTSAARERSHYVHSRPRSELTLTFNAEGLVTHEQPVGLRPRQPVGLRPRHLFCEVGLQSHARSLEGLVLPRRSRYARARELFNYVDNVVLKVGSISQ